MKERSQPPPYFNLKSNDRTPEIILNERMEEQGHPMPPPSVRAIQSVGSFFGFVLHYAVYRRLFYFAHLASNGGYCGELIGVRGWAAEWDCCLGNG